MKRRFECPRCGKYVAELLIESNPNASDSSCPVACAECFGIPPIAGSADPEYSTRIDAQRVTREFQTKSTRRLDSGSGHEPIEDSPLFGGARQGDLFQ